MEDWSRKNGQIKAGRIKEVGPENGRNFQSELKILDWRGGKERGRNKQINTRDTADKLKKGAAM